MLRRLCEKLSRNLPARNIQHPTGDTNGRPYLRRYYLATICGVRFYLHHFVDSDPDGLHNHPWRFGGSVILAGWYWEERRWCQGKKARRISLFNIVNGDTLHRVIVPEELRASSSTIDIDGGGWHKLQYSINPKRGVWTIFWHTAKVMPWATLKDKGIYTHYYTEDPTYEVQKGHSTWYLTAPKGKELFG